jgi:hypothetical protein
MEFSRRREARVLTLAKSPEIDQALRLGSFFGNYIQNQAIFRSPSTLTQRALSPQRPAQLLTLH